MADDERTRSTRQYATARTYLNDPDRFAETHDPEDLARQVPLKAKMPRQAAPGSGES